MTPIDRRTLLAGSALAAGAALLPETAEASTLVQTQVRTLRERWATHRQDVRDTLFLDRPQAGSDPYRGASERLGEGFGALSILKELEAVPLRSQAHPAMQSLIRDAAGALGDAVVGCRELLEGFLAGAAQDEGQDDPDREAHLKAALRGIRLGLGEWKTSAGRVKSLEQGLLAIEREEVPGALLRRVRRAVARIRRAEALSVQLEERPDSGVLALSDPAAQAELLEGQQLFMDLEPEAPRNTAGRIVLGMLLIGVATFAGLIVIVGLACTIDCGGVAGIFILLAGLAVSALCIWGALKLFKAPKPRDDTEVADLPEGLGPRRQVGGRHLPVLGGEGWVDTPLERGADTLLLVRARGLVRAPGRWMADADGNSVAAGEDALVPGAPLGAVVGRVGDEVFFLGGEGVVPPGAPGRLQLAVNHAGRGEGLKGHFVAEVLVLEPGHGVLAG